MSCWRVEFTPRAAKQLRKLDKPLQRRMLAQLRELSALGDPRVRGKALTGNWSGYWRWRVGDYRIIASVEDKRVLILVVTIGHRSAIYET